MAITEGEQKIINLLRRLIKLNKLQFCTEQSEVDLILSEPEE